MTAAQPTPAAPHQGARRRILFSTLSYAPHPGGGAERQAQLQAEELVRRGHDVTVVTPRWPGTRSGFLNGVRIWRLPMIDRRPLRRLSFLAVFGVAAPMALRRYNLLHAHLADPIVDLLATAGRLRHQPLYVTLAGPGPLGDIAQLRRHAAHVTRFYGLRHAAAVQALTADLYDEAVAVGVRPERIVRIGNGVDTRRFRPATEQERHELRRRLALPLDRTIVVYAGRFAAHKGVGDLVSAWQSTNWPDATLVLVGSAVTSDWIGPIAPSRNLFVRDFTPRLEEYLRAADVFVLPSHSEGLPNALLEAMACGLAVIASRVGAAKTLIEDGGNGWHVQPRTPHDLTRALRRAIAEPELRRRTGSAAWHTIAEGYTIERIVDQIEAVYERLLRGALPNPPCDEQDAAGGSAEERP